jgi:hypothetical protein
MLYQMMAGACETLKESNCALVGGHTAEGKTAATFSGSGGGRLFVIVWLYGCMVVWLYGCMVVWLYGCMVVWLSPPRYGFPVLMLFVTFVFCSHHPFPLPFSTTSGRIVVGIRGQRRGQSGTRASKRRHARRPSDPLDEECRHRHPDGRRHERQSQRPLGGERFGLHVLVQSTGRLVFARPRSYQVRPWWLVLLVWLLV